MNVPWNITWTKDAAQIVRARGQVDYRKWSIFIDDLMESDSGAYMCKVCNLHGCVNFTTRLQVQGELLMINTCVLINLLNCNIDENGLIC